VLNITTEVVSSEADVERTAAKKSSLKQYVLEKLRTWVNSLLEAERELFSKALNEIFYAPTESAARAAFFKVKEQWGRLFPSAVQVIERDLDSLRTFFQFDPTYWTVLRTTNPIERLNKEFKRRTKAMEVTGGEISTYRCLVYVSQTMEYRWSFHPLSQWSTVYTLNAA